MLKLLLRDTAIYGVAALVSRGLALLLLPIYTRVLSPGEYGAFDIILMVGTLAALIVPLEVTQALARFFGDIKEKAERRQLASTALWFTIAAYALAFILAFLLAQPLTLWLFGDEALTIAFQLGAGYIALNGLFYLMQNQLRFELRSKDYALLSCTYAVLTLALGLLFGFGLDLGLTGIMSAQLAAALLSVLLGLFLLRGSYTLSFDAGRLRAMLIFSLPLVPSGLATFFTLYANRLLLNTMTSLEAVGIFGVAARIAATVGLLIIGLQSALTPLIYAHHAEPQTPASLARLFEGFVALAGVLCLALGLFASELLMLVAEPGYAAAAPLIMALAPAALLSQMYIFFPGIPIARKTQQQLYIFVASAIGSLLTNWLLIGLLGLTGAAIATLAASLFFMGLWIRASQRLYPLPIRWRIVAAICFAFTGAAACGLLIQQADWPSYLTLSARVALMAAFISIVLLSGIGSLSIRLMFARIRA